MILLPMGGHCVAPHDVDVEYFNKHVEHACEPASVDGAAPADESVENEKTCLTAMQQWQHSAINFVC